MLNGICGDRYETGAQRGNAEVLLDYPLHTGPASWLRVTPSLNCLPSREILPQGGSDLLQRPVDLIAGDHKWRGDADRVLMGVLRKDASAL